MTERFPGFFIDKNGNRVRENFYSMSIPTVSEEVANTTLASFLKQAGYDFFFEGKLHLQASLMANGKGVIILER